MRNILEKVHKCDYDAVKADAQAIYRADGRAQAQAAARAFCQRWRTAYPRMVRQLQADFPELLSFFRFPRHLWKKLLTTNLIERCFVEVRPALGPWSALRTCRAWIASSTPSSSASTWNGKPAPFGFLHKQLDVTHYRIPFNRTAMT